MGQKSEKEAAEAIVGDPGKCVIPGQDEWAYDYFNQQLDKKQEQAFEEHLFECDRCQDVILMLDWAYSQIRRNANQYASPPAKPAKKKPASKAKSSKGGS